MEEKTSHNPAFTRFAGTKFIGASKEITKAAYCALRGWTMPENEDPNEIGRMVQYDQPEGQEPTPGYDGYISWSPKFAFDEAYRESGQMNFGHAIEAMKSGKRVSRSGWNGKGMWIVLMTGMNLPPFNTQGTERKVNDRTAKWIGEDTPLETLPYFAMWTADKKWLPGWLASQTDMLAEDWVILG